LIPALALGFLFSGIIHEFIPSNWVERHLGGKGFKPIMLGILIGAISPVCCWGSLPIALSFRKKGAGLGPIFSILVTTPATSMSALFVTWRFMGIKFTAYMFFAIIIVGFIMGLIGDLLNIKLPDRTNGAVVGNKENDCCHCSTPQEKNSFYSKVKGALKFAFIDMLKEIGLQLIIGILLAALVMSAGPIGEWIKSYLTQGYGYLFAILYGLIIYMCATGSVPLVQALVSQGLNIGAGMCLLLLGPVVSYATVLVLKKEFGLKVTIVFVVSITILCLLTGLLYTLW
jgi:uncharacterized membrane protein YraQ (UPF0718 family)